MTRPGQARHPEVTSRIMASVPSRNSRAELALRQVLHAAGVRYRLHASDVVGRPDLVWRRRRIAVFVDGDLWHGNPELLERRGRTSWGDLFRRNTEYWVEKIARNVARDQHVTAQLAREGWVVVRLWESEILKDPEAAAAEVLHAVHGRSASAEPEGGTRR